MAQDEIAPDGPVLRGHFLGLAARDAIDEMELLLLRKTLHCRPSGSFEILPVQMLASEMLAKVERDAPDAVVISGSR